MISEVGRKLTLYHRKPLIANSKNSLLSFSERKKNTYQEFTQHYVDLQKAPTLEDTDIMVSFDVGSLHTYVPNFPKMKI